MFFLHFISNQIGTAFKHIDTTGTQNPEKLCFVGQQLKKLTQTLIDCFRRIHSSINYFNIGFGYKQWSKVIMKHCKYNNSSSPVRK